MKTRTLLGSLGVGLFALNAIGCSGARERVADCPVRNRATLVAKPVSSVENKSVVKQAGYEDGGWQTAAPESLPAEQDSDLASDHPSAIDAEWLSETPPPDAFDTAGGMTLEALQELALSNSPSIQQASSAANKVNGFRTQVGLRPNPTIGYFGEEIGNDGAAGLHGAFVSQTFVRGDKLAWNKEVLGHDEQAVLWQVEAQRYRVRTDVQMRFYDALAAQERIKLAREFLSVANEGVRVAEDRLEAAVGTRPDILQSEIQVKEVELSIQRAEFDYEAAWKDLVAVAGVPDMPPSNLIGSLDNQDLDREIETIYAQIESESPLLRSAEARVRRAKSNIGRQGIQPLPNVTGQLGLGYDDGTGDGFANVQLSLPVPINNRNEGNIAAAHAEFCEATQNVQRIKMQIRSSLARVTRNYRAASATVQQYESSIIPKARETLELVLTAQEAGEISFLRVLTARRTVFDVNQQYVSALSEKAQANAQLDGLLLTGGLSNVVAYDGGDDLRGQALSGQ